MTLLVMQTVARAQGSTDSLLRELTIAIEKAPAYDAAKEQRIAGLQTVGDNPGFTHSFGGGDGAQLDLVPRSNGIDCLQALQLLNGAEYRGKPENGFQGDPVRKRKAQLLPSWSDGITDFRSVGSACGTRVRGFGIVQQRFESAFPDDSW